MSGFSLKDNLFNREKVEYLASLFGARDKTFPKRKFVSQVMQELPALELKQRIKWIAESLERYLPADFCDSAALIVGSLPPPLDDRLTDDDFGDFIFAPLGEFVVRRGLSSEHISLSLATLRELTMRFSMEDAMRYFLREFPDQTLNELTRWTEDKNYHVRRLVSESTRPLLPWSARINLPAECTLRLLDKLHADPTRYVTRSVANHLNDLAKSQSQLVVETLQSWHKQAQQKPTELMWMTRHALRTLIKRGDAASLSLLGFRPQPKISVGPLQIARYELKPGESVCFQLEVTSLRDESLIVDYSIDFVKAGGKRSSKVFKATKFTLKKGEARTITKQHKLHAQATTYQLYPGEHLLTVLINGQRAASAAFWVRSKE